MNILIVSQYFYPEVFKINDIAVELVNRGNSVSVVTGLPNYPEGEIFDGYKNKLFDDYYGVKIYRTKIRPRHKGTINLFLNYMSFMRKAKKTVKKIGKKFDIIFCFEPSPIFQLTPAIFAKQLNNCPLVLMCCDQWPESLKARGLKKGPAFKIVANYCIKNLNKCDHILNVAPSFIEYNHKVNKVPIEKMSWFIQPSDDFGIQESNEEKDTTDLIFAGNIGQVQNVEDIVMAYSLLKYPNLRIHIYGDGSNRSACEELAAKEKVRDNVIFYGRVSPNVLKTKFKYMDACLLTLSGKSNIGNTIPSKLTSYFSTGKPIIAAIGGDSKELIETNQCGLCCPPDNIEELSKIIDKFYKNKKTYLSYGKKAREYFINNCTLQTFIDKLEMLFRSCVKYK